MIFERDVYIRTEAYQREDELRHLLYEERDILIPGITIADTDGIYLAPFVRDLVLPLETAWSMFVTSWARNIIMPDLDVTYTAGSDGNGGYGVVYGGAYGVRL